MNKGAAAADPFRLGVLFADGLAVIIHCAPIVESRDLCVRPGECCAHGHCARAAADLQQLSLSVKIKIAENGFVNLFHHTALSEGILTANPCHPAGHDKQNGNGDGENNSEHGDFKHGKGQHGQRRSKQYTCAESVEHGI